MSADKDLEAQGLNANAAPTSYSGDPASHDEAPPNYNEVVDPTDSPPSYESLFGRMKQAKKESSGCLDFAKNFFVIFFGTLGCTVMVAVVLAIPISMIVIGTIYLHDCTIERYIPIYLIVGGVFGVIKNLSTMGQRIANHKKQSDDQNAKPNPFDGLISCFLLAWFIAGNVWIYRAHGSVNTKLPESPQYCNYTLYWFAFWITTSTYILLAGVCCCMCCVGLLAACIN